jgi:hypothetical protein
MPEIDPLSCSGREPIPSSSPAPDRRRWSGCGRPTVSAGTPASAAFDGKLFLALPSEPEHAAAQEAALAAADVLIEALKRAGRDLSREGLVDQLESLNGFATGSAPAITFGPARRLGARGAYVVRVEGRELKGEDGWVAAD